MITKNNFKDILKKLNFSQKDNFFFKKFDNFECELKVDFKKEQLIYPEDRGLIVNDKTTSNFSNAENFVVFECVDRLLTQGYNPKHIELEKKWQLGHTQKSGKADIYIKDNDNNSLLIIECKTAGIEYKKAINILENDSRNQLFSYFQQVPNTKFLALYTSDFIDKEVISNYYLINVTDNKELLENDKTLKGYKDASLDIDKYNVWCETYDKEYDTIGLFENNEAYKIGKNKFSIDDLKDISSKDIQGKYYEFATILRQHNVSGRENAFDKLVNLFLCKVTDEKENPNELKFYWRGKSYDDPFDFQDRLQQLYKIGMDKFLEDKIVYVANDEIDEAFGVFKDKPNATKDAIKEFVKELKFFTNNDFAFIDVHNENLFKQNFKVLLEISQIIQNIKLTGSEENQFLGDMFESFLDQGVKQSEGQFFTPMPLVKFIINSLPKKQNPKVIDYACGSGHFLNEYAIQNKNAQIIGVEKEYRLSKVAKVSSFMYGSDIDIIYSDALSKNKKLKDNTFDVLIANPPYSVKGFLQTLNDEDKSKFELIDEVDSKSYSKTGAIECFFIERAKQLLTKDAVVGIIVPSSILNKDTPKLYIKTREIILSYFDIIAICEFGSGTFGKTGTNTVTLFLRRISDNPNLKQHYINMIDEWFNLDFDTNKAFKDSDILEEYCNYIDIDFKLYKDFIFNILDKELLEKEIFKEYKVAFLKKSNTKNRKKRKQYKDLTKEKQIELEEKEFIKYIKQKEKDKLLYYALTQKQSNNVIIVKSPSKNDENKKFLGYEWGGRKGNEGIQYFTSAKIELDDKLEDEDKRVLKNLQGLKYINTPLYNPSDIDDNSKINKLIKDNFNGIDIIVPDELKRYVSKSSLVDMLDFKRVEFNKAINLNPAKKVDIKSKWKLVKLGEIIDVRDGTHESPKFYPSGYPLITSKNLIDGEINFDNIKYISKEDFISINKRSKVDNGDILFAMIGTVGNPILVNTDKKFAIKNVALFKNSNIELNNYFLCQLLDYNIVKQQIKALKKGTNREFVSLTILRNLKIPLPPLNIQEKIVQECEIVDKEVEKADKDLKELKNKIENEIKQSNGVLTKLIHITSKIGSGATPKGGEKSYKESGITLIRSQNIYDNEFYKKGLVFIDDIQAKRLDNVTIEENDILFNITGASVARCCLVDKSYLPARVNQHVAIIRPKLEKILPKYLQKILVSKNIKKELINISKTSLSREAINKSQLEEFKIPLPPLETQKQIISEIEILEDKIKKNNDIINSSKNRKEKILKKYL